MPVLRENHSAPAAGRIHGDDATVPVLAKNKAVTGRLWTAAFARAGSMSEMTGPLAAAIRRPAMFFYSRGRGGEHPRRHLAGWAGILQADAGACPRAGQRPDPGAGFGELDEARRSPRPITEAACRAHGRRKFFVLADLRQGPLRGHSGATQGHWRIEVSSPHRRDLRRRARDQRCRPRLSSGMVRALGRPAGTDQAAGCRTGRLDANRARPAIAPRRHRRRHRQGHRLQGHRRHGEARAGLHPVSR